MRVLNAKYHVGLHRKRLVDLEAIGDQIESPEADDEAQSVADRAVTLVKNDRTLVPLADKDNTAFVVLTETRYGQQGRVFADELRTRAPKAKVVLLDPSVPEIELDQVREQVSSASAVVVAAFVSVAAYRGDVALRGGFPSFVEKLAAGSAPVILVSLGNPYLVRSFPSVPAYMATFSPAPTSETAAVKALLGAIPIRGKLPVSIPGIAAYGDGIEAGSSAAPANLPQVLR
jgi:beta-N-acetylhexosaminidase